MNPDKSETLARAINHFYDEHGPKIASRILDNYREGDDLCTLFALCDQVRVEHHKVAPPKDIGKQRIGSLTEVAA